jgi:hypothetical protein
MTNTNAPWNKGKTGLEAGWTEERRQRASRNQKIRIQQDPRKFYAMFRSGPQPHMWIAGPDPELRDRRTQYSRRKAQANHRGEGWTLTVKQWERLWPLDKWRLRGKSKHHLIMTRKDLALPWQWGNVVVKPRVGNMSRVKKWKRDRQQRQDSV